MHVKLKESGTLIAVSYCNLHGLWESSAEIAVE
ncbi:desulfoferrodoxin family protein [Pyramidobacter porci]